MSRSQSFLNLLPSSPGLCLALLGGGGKTSLLLHLGREFAQQNTRVLLTSLTRAGHCENPSIILTKSQDALSLTSLFRIQNPVYLLHSRIRPDKYQGLLPDELERLKSQADVTLFECDGSRNRPLKAHTAGDPLVPAFTSHVIIVIGADVIDTNLHDGNVHRPEQFQTLWEIPGNPVMDIAMVTRTVTHPKGYPAKIPATVEKIYFVNKADLYPEKAESLARSIARETSAAVCWGSVNDSWWQSVS